MKRFRIFALVLCLCLLVTGLSGCNKEDVLRAEKEQEIKEAYVVFYNENKVDQSYKVAIENVSIIHYFGTYNGAEVILIYPTDSTLTTLGKIHVAGYVIYTPTRDDPVYAYKDGIFTEIEEAYENGMLTEEDIADIASQTGPPENRS